MIKDLFTSLKDNITQKSTNPFLGTFILVWIIKNWKFVYTLFNFDKSYVLEKRLLTIESYFENYHTWKNLGSCILISILVLLITYSLLALSRFIVNVYDKIVTPIIYKATDKSSIVLKSDYNKIRQEVIRLESRLEEERENKIRLQNDYEALEKRIAETIIKRETVQNENATKAHKSIEFNQKANLLINKLRKDNLLNEFEKVSSNV